MAKYIWTDADGGGLNRYVLFRRSFELAGEPRGGEINIFADTRYRLIVNGTVVGHGPARFFAAKPEYDVYDIAPFLRQGRNVVAAVVNSYGDQSFHSEAGIGGLVAWGQAADDAGASVSLDTDDGWKAVPSPGHRSDTSKLSFALNRGELLDTRLMPQGWDLPEFDDADWPDAVPIEDQDHWGELCERSIPLLDEREILARRRIGTWVARYAEEEEVHSFILMTGSEKFHGRNQLGGAFTWLHSPRGQDVTLGGWWGSYWLNGRLLQPREREDVSLRRDFPVRLKEGWNSLFITETCHSGAWECLLGLPRGAGLEISAEKESDSPNTFLLAGPWSGEALERAKKDVVALTSPDDLPDEYGPWQPWPRDRTAGSAYSERCWKTLMPIPGDDSLVVSGRRYASVVGRDTLVLLYDFGTEVLGRPILDLTAGEGTVVDLAYSEQLVDGMAGGLRGHNVRMAERYVMRGGRQRLQTFHPRGMRYLEVLVQGRLDGFELHGVALSRANYPVRDIGRFKCSDPVLNDVWRLGRATLHACMEDAYLDCPRRERGLYSGDFFVQFHSNLAAFGDTALFRRCIELFLLGQDERGFIGAGAHGLTPGRHPDYTAILAQALWRYYEATGDIDFLRSMQPRLKKLLDGLAGLQLPDGDLLDGSDMSPYIDLSHMDRGGINCALNCFYQRGFHDGARILNVLGDAEAAATCRSRADALAAAIRREFWDEERGVFTDRRRADVPDTDPSIPANALPLLYDIADERQAPRVLEWVLDAMAHNFRVPDPRRPSDSHVTAYFSFYALGTLYKYGKVAEAEEFIRANWGWMLDKGAWTCWEFFTPRASLCHAWGSSPTHYLSTQVLGVTFPEPGNSDQVLIAPHPGSLTWAEGIYPHPAGPIRVSWRVQGGQLLLEVEAPEGVDVQTAIET